MKIPIVLTAIAALCSLSFAQTPPIPARQRMVIVISLDGFPAYALDDPKLPIPTLRRLIQNGGRGRMTMINPTVTWPNHTTFVTGVRADEHGLLVNGSLVPTGAWPPVRVDPKVDKEKMVRAPTVYDAAHRAGLTTAQIDWVAISNAATITYPFMEWASPAGAVEQEMIRKGVITAADVQDFDKFNILWRDQIWTKAAAFLIREHKPNLMLLHFLSLDSTHHQFGPRTLAATAAMAFLDSCVEKVVDAVRDAGMTDRTTFLVLADHGFKGYTKQIRPAVAFADAGVAGKTHVISEGGTAIVYLEKSSVAELLPKATQALEGMEGLDKIIGTDGFAAIGLPTPDRDPQMGHLLLTAKDGYSFSGATGGPVTAAVAQLSGSHGYIASDPEMDAIFIASGYGVRKGVTLDRFPSVDVAPTIAKLLGVSLPTAKGKPLPLQ